MNISLAILCGAAMLALAACGDDFSMLPSAAGGTGGKAAGSGGDDGPAVQTGTGAVGGGAQTSTQTGAGAQGGFGAQGGAGATGGSGATGGAGATGGSGPTGTGGAGATGGAGVGGGGSGGLGGAPECTDSTECALVNDCCSCVSIPIGRVPPPCAIDNCFVPTCTSIGQPDAQATCSVGQCVAGFNCDPSMVACASPMPVCPLGQTASVSGLCWGGCVPTTECGIVGSCAQCAATQACVKEVTQIGTSVHCVPIPPACDDKPSCACMGGGVCVGIFDTCTETAEGLECTCSAC
jgi:hypothetical protein